MAKVVFQPYGHTSCACFCACVHTSVHTIFVIILCSVSFVIIEDYSRNRFMHLCLPFVAPDGDDGDDDDEHLNCHSQTCIAAGHFEEALDDAEHMIGLKPELPEVRLWKQWLFNNSFLVQ